MSYNLLKKDLGAIADNSVTHSATFIPAKQVAVSTIQEFPHEIYIKCQHFSLKSHTEEWSVLLWKGHTRSKDALRKGKAMSTNMREGVPKEKINEHDAITLSSTLRWRTAAWSCFTDSAFSPRACWQRCRQTDYYKEPHQYKKQLLHAMQTAFWPEADAPLALYAICLYTRAESKGLACIVHGRKMASSRRQ